MPNPGKFTLISRTVQILAPREWTDEQAQALFDQLGDDLDAAIGALGTRVLERHPNLSVISHD